MEPRLTNGELAWGERRVPVAGVEGFHAAWDEVLGRGVLLCVGPGWRVPLDAEHGARWRALRAEFPARPFTTDWDHGLFPGAGAAGLRFGAALSVAAVATAVVAHSAGVVAALGAAIGLGWALAGLRTTLQVSRRGVRAGPVWAGNIPWHRVRGVRVSCRGHAAHLRVLHDDGVAAASVPLLLLPAVRARLRRIGGVRLEVADPDLEEWYLQLAPYSAAAPWALLVICACAAPFTSRPWDVAAAGTLAAGSLAFVDAAVSARRTGWGTGAILWMGCAWALLMAAAAWL